MKKLLLYGHGGAYNHGAEAILHASIPIFRQLNYPIFLSTHFPEQDRAFGLDKLVDQLIPADLSLVAEERVAKTFAERERIAARIYRDALAEVDGETVCIGVGGDNYCYPNWHRQSVFHHTVKARGGRSILWGCSIQPEQIDERMESVLRGHDHIYTRESLTTQAMWDHGILQVTQLPDPAFMLEEEPVALPGHFGRCTVGLNLSPLLLRRSETLLSSFAEVSRLLLERADALLMIPHVTMPVDDDQAALRELERLLPREASTRICWAPEGYSAAQRKYLISKCEMLICCRTHASIAGYSAGIPTLVIGYSVKSQGIGRDLGMEKWVIPVERCAELPPLTLKLWEERDRVRNNLMSLKEHSYQYWDALKRSIGEYV